MTKFPCRPEKMLQISNSVILIVLLRCETFLLCPMAILHLSNSSQTTSWKEQDTPLCIIVPYLVRTT